MSSRLSRAAQLGDEASPSPVGALLAARHQGLLSPTSSFIQRKKAVVVRPELASRQLATAAGSALAPVAAATAAAAATTTATATTATTAAVVRRESAAGSNGLVAIGFAGAPDASAESRLPVFEMADLEILNTFTHCVWVTTMKRGFSQYVFANKATLEVWGCTSEDMLEMDLESHESESTQRKRDMLYELVQVGRPLTCCWLVCACSKTAPKVRA